MVLKKNDFIEVEYTGRIKEGNSVFDTTDEKTAKDSGIFHKQMKYGPVVVVLGESHLLTGLDSQLQGKEAGKYSFEISPEEGFGKKTADLLKLVPAKAFSKEQIKPFVGLEVEMDGLRGIVRSVSGGRIIVDFNHPLAGKTLLYDVNVLRVITDPSEKIKGIARLLKIPLSQVEIEGNKATLSYDQNFPVSLAEHFESEVKRLLGVEITKNPDAHSEEKNSVNPSNNASELPEQKKEN